VPRAAIDGAGAEAGGALRVLAIELVDLACELIDAAAADGSVARLRGTVVGATMPHLLDGLGLLSSFPLEWSRQLLPHLH